MYSIDCLPMLLSTVLETSAGEPASMASLDYYERLATYVTVFDPDLMALLARAIVHTRKTYRSASQHHYHVSMVPMQKRVDDRVREFLDQNCPVCLHKLGDDPRGVVRLKAAEPGQRCGHFMHRNCFERFEAQNINVVKSCPVCREDLGLIVNLWEDHESALPKF